MEVVFITNMDINDKSGGARACEHNYESLCLAFGKSHVHFIKAQYHPNDTKLQKATRYWHIIYHGTEYINIFPILSTFLQYDLVFLDSTHLSFVAKWLKKNEYKGTVCTYVHNCEYDFVVGLLKPYHNGPVKRLMYWHAKRNEQNTILYSDKLLFINRRDRNRMIELYGDFKTPWESCPIALKDQLNDTEDRINAIHHSKKVLTFIGTYFGPNITGIKWFIEHVFPHIDAELRVVGRGMGNLRRDIKTKRIHIFSDVDDLSPFMIDSDYMIFPIFDGSGMKIKTCESLMYAKNIIATPEAFSGYEIEDFSKVGACCSTAEEFINAIRQLNMPRYNSYSRDIFLRNYSFEKGVKQFRNLLKQD